MACCGDDGYSLFSTDNQYGEKYQYDVDFKGPKSRRSHTDVYWLVGFLVFTSVWLMLGACVLMQDSNNAHQAQLMVNIGIRAGPEQSVIFEYLKQTLWCYLSTIALATVICLVLIHVMQWIATPVVWFSICLMITTLLAAAIGGFIAYSEETLVNPNEAGDELGVGIGFTIMTLVFILCVYLARHKIAVAIALIKEGSKAVASSYSTVFFPIIPTIFQIGIFAIFASVLMNIQFIGSHDDDGIRAALHMMNLFGFLWTYWFMNAFQKMVLAHVFATWYWTYDKKNLPMLTLTTAVVRTTRYHLGTVALGSVLIVIGQIICYMIKIIMNNRYMRVFRLCCDITEIIERFLQFLNKNTFIMVAIHGNPFCQSMRDAFNLLMRNIASVYVTSRVTTLQFALFNIVISAGMGGLTYLFIDNVNPDLIWYPIGVAVVGSYIVSSTFFKVYAMSIDTMFLCFLEDIERNDGSEQRPYYMSQTLMKVIHKNSENLLPPPYEHV